MIPIHTRTTSILADTITPVSIYLKVRDRFANSFLLESADYHGDDNTFSYICCSPIAHISIDDNVVAKTLPNAETQRYPLTDLQQELSDFAKNFSHTHTHSDNRHVTSGLFGYINYEAKAAFEKSQQILQTDTPIAQYTLFQFVIPLDHFKNECHIIEAYTDTPDDDALREVTSLIQQRNIPDYPFRLTGSASSNKTDDEYRTMVEQGIAHCQQGDVFQVVLSRRFETPYQGDDFQVYRHLRSVNPSPYLFYFDYGSFRLCGSSPEAQIIVNNGQAEIHPIAGTFKRTGDDTSNQQSATELLKDPKEDAEHVMLVDLARNDLSHCCDNVTVNNYKAIQFFSHVIHLVSRVTGILQKDKQTFDVMAETFPAGTLSGAPKIRAMEIIAEQEQSPRGFYGGAIGFMDFQGNFNHAIMIRTLMSKNGILTYQAGAGVVAKSDPESELNEVYNKIGALEQAMRAADNSSAQGGAK